MRSRDIHLVRVVERFAEALESIHNAGDAVIVKRGTLRSIVMKCPCGCGDVIPINLDERAGPAWQLFQERDGAITLFPSVWRESGCRSHFIAWRNRVYLFGESDDGGFTNATLRKESEKAIAEAIVKELPQNDLVDYAVIARNLGMIPWDVLAICRQLVRVGAARQGTGSRGSCFGRIR